MRASSRAKRTKQSAEVRNSGLPPIVHMCAFVRNPRTFLIENRSLR
ncbi:hypothetical protein HMPREF3196_02014 [Bifidobacterium bifidum]|uniref:Uncharacterized protein n=1 Tax=Bifidobacterium bifidum TaxID=1681 RepID=A0A133KKP6_BIFBI|nr:hypothetical protein BIFBIF_02104 [Bifidobacterium bifidum ATCC 29521 = JCM 1255 = DSM 20456]KWZ80088.1 hypothetical protein HMPREF3196_02014 [Bifidobacterium bifidum]